MQTGNGRLYCVSATAWRFRSEINDRRGGSIASALAPQAGHRPTVPSLRRHNRLTAPKGRSGPHEKRRPRRSGACASVLIDALPGVRTNAGPDLGDLVQAGEASLRVQSAKETGTND